MEIKSKVDLSKHDYVILEYCRVEQTRIGNVLDAQDYLGAWHLAIVIEEKNSPQKPERKIHFLPYEHSRRDEVFTDEDSNRIAPIFTQTEISSDPEKSFRTLRDYLTNY